VGLHGLLHFAFWVILKTCTVKFFIVYLEISAEIIMNNKETMQEI